MMLYECEVSFIDGEFHTRHDTAMYEIHADSPEEAEAEALERAEDHKSWSWKDYHECTVTEIE